MRLTTRCPACATRFRVVPDQLRLADGWVRCGRCSEVFDARQALQEQADADNALAPDALPPLLHEPQAEPPPELQDETTYRSGSGSELVPEPPGEVADAPAADRIVEPTFDPALRLAPAVVSETALEAVPETEPESASETASKTVVGQASGLPAEREEPWLEPTDPAAAAANPVTVEPEAPVSFLRAPSPPSARTRPGVRALLALGCVMALLLLGFQIAVHERDRLAAQAPDWRPWLQALCQPLDCTVSPLRRIDAVVIDASGLVRLRDDAYRLQLALSNKSAVELAVPAIELTLTDAADQPVLRRVILPAELGDATALAGGAQWNSQVVFSVANHATRIAGYRVLAFYP